MRERTEAPRADRRADPDIESAIGSGFDGQCRIEDLHEAFGQLDPLLDRRMIEPGQVRFPFPVRHNGIDIGNAGMQPAPECRPIHARICVGNHSVARPHRLPFSTRRVKASVDIFEQPSGLAQGGQIQPERCERRREGQANAVSHVAPAADQDLTASRHLAAKDRGITGNQILNIATARMREKIVRSRVSLP